MMAAFTAQAVLATFTGETVSAVIIIIIVSANEAENQLTQ